MESKMELSTRRRFLAGLAVSGAALELDPWPAVAQTMLPPTPECRDGDEPTPRQTEGPYFRPRSPERTDLRDPYMAGRLLELSGFVLTRNCKPFERALIDVWQANDRGEYDNRGFKLRGHLFTDARGAYRFRTIVPGIYEGRTRHIHLKVQAPGTPVLTTQLYFPDEPHNRKDGLYRKELVMAVAGTESGLSGTFNFVLNKRA
jgi:protocatechuate 3,4-dioxygenase beta subunit